MRIPRASARSDGAPDHRPLGERVGEREAELDDVGAALDRGARELRRLGLGHQVDDELLVRVTVARVAASPRYSRCRAKTACNELVQLSRLRAAPRRAVVMTLEHLGEVLVAAAGEAHEDQLRVEVARAGERVRAARAPG